MAPPSCIVPRLGTLHRLSFSRKCRLLFVMTRSELKTEGRFIVMDCFVVFMLDRGFRGLNKPRVN